MPDTLFWIADSCDADLCKRSEADKWARNNFTVGQALESFELLERMKKAAREGDF